eukprot:CAMPEP_0181377326 /NCGR_PEP_ID=MMETSP1106-20121128/17838_1 /TAXON_ID=81844 /ORGANISM="Mantoniella antarctica, Strain SL-175" /LENGTH=161 /DNA_ID=CAMNT_0023496055 /DNA_START=200 /DNA_END=685 /DNA_ORIENTATION=-
MVAALATKRASTACRSVASKGAASSSSSTGTTLAPAQRAAAASEKPPMIRPSSAGWMRGGAAGGSGADVDATVAAIMAVAVGHEGSEVPPRAPLPSPPDTRSSIMASGLSALTYLKGPLHEHVPLTPMTPPCVPPRFLHRHYYIHSSSLLLALVLLVAPWD